MVNNFIQGAMYPAISNNDVKNTTLPVPTKIEEQEKIALEVIKKIYATYSIRDSAHEQEKAVNTLQGSI
jgi:hypothetical protein